MERHSGKTLYLIKNPQPFRRLGILVVCGTLVLQTCFRYNYDRKKKRGRSKWNQLLKTCNDMTEQLKATDPMKCGDTNKLYYSTKNIQLPGATSTAPVATVSPCRSGSSSFSPRTRSLPFKVIIMLRMPSRPARA